MFSFYRSGTARDSPFFTTPGPLGTGLGLAVPHFLQVRDRSGLAVPQLSKVQDCDSLYPRFFRSGTARDWPGTRRTPVCTGPGLLGTCRTPVFAGLGPLGTNPGLAAPQFLQVRDRGHRSGTARDWPGIATPQFLQVRDRLGFAVSKFLQVRDRSALARDSLYPSFYRSGTGPGLAVPQFLQVRDRSGPARDSPYPSFYWSGTAYPVWLFIKLKAHKGGRAWNPQGNGTPGCGPGRSAEAT